ncbi:hypothetical protein NHQ30_005062 [Ciborinia camelliae]|nr:hypothetical protein NHQ30_005062 [Ciborinia camelliae]
MDQIRTQSKQDSSHGSQTLPNCGTKANRKQCDPELLFHAKDALILRKSEEKEKDEPNQILVNDIGTALRFVDEDFGHQMQSLDSLLKNGEITFDLLWAIMKPKDLLVSMQYGLTTQLQAMDLVSGRYQKRDNGARYFQIEGRIISHDGEDFGYGFIDIEIDDFDGAKKITSLQGYPLHYDPHQDTIRKNLIQRGRKYLTLIQASPICQEYTITFGLKENEFADGRTKIQKTNVCRYSSHNKF